jgi:YesN/AraC family two-component response regulator
MLPITLSIVEDLDEVREGLSCYLGSHDEFLILETFRNAEEAAAKLPEIEPDIVIMDINLPGMNGIDCIREVKRKCNTIQFIMFTVYETDDKIF